MPADFLVFGAGGQVGSALRPLLGERAVFLDYPETDFTRPESLLLHLKEHRPSVVINAAAHTAVDQAEQEEARATLINADAPGLLARWCADHDAVFAHYSTDYVFDGSGEHARTEEEPTGPLSAYGRSKLAGERSVSAAQGKHLIFRTSWVYDAFGKNFMRTMLRFGAEREVLKVVADQFGAPTYAPHLARATLEAINSALGKTPFPSGIYHLCNTGVTSWHQFAQAIFEGAQKRGATLRVHQVDPLPTSAWPTPARRPLNSRLNTEKAKHTLGVELPHWSIGLAEALDLFMTQHRALENLKP